MPSKGTTLKHGNRDYVFDRKFFKNLVEKNPKMRLTYAQCSEVIRHANKEVAHIIETEDDGFKLPFGLGYVCATKYTPNKPMIDWKNTEKIGIPGKFAYHNNFHTLGFSIKISWFRVGRVTNSKLNETWKFKAMTPVSKAISLAFRKGKPYIEWKHSDFIEKGRLENLYNKKYRTELKD